VFDLYDELTAIVDLLETREIAYALCGGIAMAVHGYTRATEDIDLFMPPDEAGRAEIAVSDLGYNVRARPMIVSNGMMQIRRVSKIDPADGDLITLDLRLVTPASEGVWATRQRLIWRDRTISVVSREGLVTLKKFRSSKIDLADIEFLEGSE
jgi:hypothetical protein